MNTSGVLPRSLTTAETTVLPWKSVLIQIALFHCLYLILTAAAAWALPSFFDKAEFLKVNARWPREGEPIFLSHFATWDAAHYLYLSENGYSKNIASCAFYPLWPLMMRWFSVVTGGNHVVSGLILANVFSISALTLFFNLLKKRLGERIAQSALVFLLLFPGSIFLHFVYSEALFFLLVMIFLTGLEQRRFWLIWGAGILLPLTRAIGIFCVFPLLYHGILRFWRPPGTSLKFEDRSLYVQMPNRHSFGRGCLPGMCSFILWVVFLGSAPLLGYILYFGFMWTWTGNPWEGFEAQKFWGHVHAISNLWDIPKFVTGIFSPTAWHEFQGSLLDRCTFIILVSCLPVIWRLDKEWFIWAIVLGIVPAMSGTFVSFTRFASMVFPMFIVFGALFSKPHYQKIRCSLLILFALLHLILLWRFVNFRWAG